MKKLHLMTLAVLVSCTSTTVEKPAEPTSSSVPRDMTTAPVVTSPVPTASTPIEVKAYKVPALQIPSDSGPAFREALSIFQEHAQSEEFYTYVRENVKKLQGGNETDVEKAITKTRECFSSLGPIQVRWQKYGIPPFYKSAAIGGWDGVQVNQNPKKVLTSVERAGHWYHELTHACKFTHVSNNIKTHPIIRQSWPYQAGYAFEDYVTFKRRVKLAAE